MAERQFEVSNCRFIALRDHKKPIAIDLFFVPANFLKPEVDDKTSLRELTLASLLLHVHQAFQLCAQVRNILENISARQLQSWLLPENTSSHVMIIKINIVIINLTENCQT